MKISRTLAAAAALLAICIASCSDDTPRLDEEGKSVEGTPEMEIEPSSPSFGIVNILRASGNKVRVIGAAERPFIPVKGKTLTVNGQQVEIYEFDSQEETDAMTDGINPDGTPKSPGGAAPFQGTPHYYRTDKVLVLYVGDDATTTTALETALGSQIAGG